jgi:hypothetical protein
MINKILTARQTLGLDYAGMREKHAEALQSLQSRELIASLVPDVDATPQTVRVDHGRWIFDCSCGSGVAADPTWPDARCLGCGTVFPVVVWPEDRAAIEAALVARKTIASRNWRPGEAVGDLNAETIALEGRS